MSNQAMSNHAMRNHEDVATERLSAYIDGELPDAEITEVEDLIARDDATRKRLEGLRRVVDGLRQTEPPPPPPPTLHHAVARRIALERERVPFLDRFEANLSPLGRNNPLLPMFAVILVLAISVYCLAVMVDRAENPSTEVIMVGEAGSVIGSRIEIGNRVLFWHGEEWRQRGTPEQPARTVRLGSAEADSAIADDPSLEAFEDIGAAAIVWIAGEAIRFEPEADP